MRSLIVAALWSAAALAQQYVISTYAGGGPPAPPSPAVAGSIGAPISVAADAKGNVYFASSDFKVIFKLNQNGVLTRVAGNGRFGYSGEGGPATSAQLAYPWGVAVDSVGNLFIAGSGNHRIRRVSPDGVIATVQPGGYVPVVLQAGNASTTAGAVWISNFGKMSRS